MPRHTRVNLLEIKDSVAGRADGVEGRFGRGPMGAREPVPVSWPGSR